VISLSEISAANFIIGLKLFACSRNKSMPHRDVPPSMKRFHAVGFILLWLSIFVSMFARKMLAKAMYQVPIRARFNVPKAA